MNDDNFIIDSMIWSYSRLTSFENCPYGWAQQYIECQPTEGNFYSDYGKLVHECHEKYEKGEIDFFDVQQYFEDHWSTDVVHEAPPNKYVDIGQKYYDDAIDYFMNMEALPSDLTVAGVEKEIRFEIAGKPFVGYIDLLLKDEADGTYIIRDHKSHNFSFLKNGELNKKGKSELEDFKRQLYLYSIPLIEAGETVKELQWNVFRNQKLISVPWKREEYEATIKWAEDTIQKICEVSEYLPSPDWYYCYNLCNVRNCGCPYKP